MIYTTLTIKALQFAYTAHQGQYDRSGVPYIFHPYHLAEQMTEETACAAALLHDVVEDTDITLNMLRAEFPAEVVDAVALLTHNIGTDYFEYIRKIKDNPIAKQVKLADLAHNSDQSRCIGIAFTPEKLRYWQEKYQRAKAILMDQE